MPRHGDAVGCQQQAGSCLRYGLRQPGDRPAPCGVAAHVPDHRRQHAPGMARDDAGVDLWDVLAAVADQHEGQGPVEGEHALDQVLLVAHRLAGNGSGPGHAPLAQEQHRADGYAVQVEKKVSRTS